VESLWEWMEMARLRRVKKYLCSPRVRLIYLSMLCLELWATPREKG
jgi:hypothetical protein